jgi:hypothetical protein
MTDHSVLLLAYGQSNADLYPAEPALPCEAFADPRILTFDDGQAFRGLLGAVRRRPVTALVPALIASEETKKTRNYQSFQIAAAMRLLQERGSTAPNAVIVRAEGRGGRRFDGYFSKNGQHNEGILTNVDGSDSQILLNTLETMQTSVELARAQGVPVRRMVVNFIHGEADRGGSRARYRGGMESMIARIDAEAGQLGLRVGWLILDPAGTSSRGSGNDWPCRQAMRDVADARANVHLIAAGYAYPLDDTIHYSSESRALFGEHFGAAAAALLARDAGTDSDLGWLLDAPRPPRAVIMGNRVELHLDGTEDFDLISGISDGALTVEGFSTSLVSRCLITTVVQTGPRSVRVVLDREPAEDARAALNYAFQILRPDATRTPSPLPAGRGGWRSVKALDSISLPGRRIHQWVPGFSIPFAEMERG